MKITITRTGGYAGLSEVTTIDTASLPSIAARHVEKLVKDMNFFNLPSEVPSAAVGADLFRYEIIVDNSQEKVVTFVDDQTPATRPLATFVQTVVKLAP